MVGVGPPVLSRAEGVLAAARVLKEGKRVFVELSGHDREDLGGWVEQRLLELDESIQRGPDVGGVQYAGGDAERLAYASHFHAGFEGGVAGALGLVQQALRGWLAGEGMSVMRYLEEVRGPGLPLPMRESLSRLHSLSGQAQEAEALLVLEASLREQALGNGHVETLAAVTALARLMMGQGKLGEATALYRHALKEYTGSVGADSPLTLRTMVSLAELLADQMLTDEAASLYRAALKGLEATMGPQHHRRCRRRTTSAWCSPSRASARWRQASSRRRSTAT